MGPVILHQHLPMLPPIHLLRLRGGKLRDEARTGGKLSDVIGPRGVFIRQKGMVTSEAHGRGVADKHQKKRFRRKERAAKIADENRMRKLGKEHIADTALEREELAPGAGEVIYAADGDVLKDMQAQQDDPYAWLEKQLDLAENTGAEVPTIQDALKRHVPIPDSVADEDSAEDSSDLGTSSSSSSRARASNQPGSDWREEQVPTRQVLTFTCFTGTKVQILTHYLTRERARRCARETRWAAGGVR